MLNLVRDCQIKTTTWYHFTPTRFVEIKVSDKVRYKDNKAFSKTGGNLNWHKVYKSIYHYLRKLNKSIPWDLAVLLQGVKYFK